LSGEFGGERHRRLVFAVRSLFERSLNFRVYGTSYDGPGTAMVSTNNESVRFDILMKQETSEGGIHYFCECKFRSSEQSRTELKSEFKDFVEKALKTLRYGKRKYGEGHFCFLFISTISFDVSEENTSNFEYLRELLENSNVDTEDLITLTRHLRIMTVPRWLVEELYAGLLRSS